MTKEQYMEAVERIARLNPGELLLPALRKGHSAATEIYLRSALRRCPDEEPDWKAQTPYADETLRALWRERTRLFGEMNKQSNLFHACKTDEERAANSAKVLSWWDDIRAVKSKIAWYEAHGELPPVAEEDDELPDNPALLAKKLNSLRARISQMKGKLKDLASLDPGTPGLQSKINAAEDDLKRLRFLEGKAAVKLKEYEQTA